MFTSDGAYKEAFALAATLAVWVIVQVPECHEAMNLYSSHLFVALLFHVVITTQQTPPEELANFGEHAGRNIAFPATPTVQALKSLLFRLRCDNEVMAMERKHGWDGLLSAQTQHYAMGLLARSLSAWISLNVVTASMRSHQGTCRASAGERRRLALRGLVVLSKDPLMDNGHVEVLSLDLFFKVMQLSADEAKKALEKILSQSLLPLFLHCHDENRRVAKASRETLLRVTDFLKRRNLKQLVKKEQLLTFAKCLKRKNQKQGNSFCIYSDHHRRERNQKHKATVSVSTQAVTEEKETKGAISISTQTVTEAEQPKPVAVAPVQKKKSKSKSVRIMTDEDVAGPSHPAEETEPEIITHSLSLGELRDLRREFTRQTNESILTWLLRIWDAAANDTILDGSEARQLGSLSRDVVIDQGIGRTQQNSQPLAATANKCEGQIPL
ncbi:hypothetical protein DUI87_04141 [Hirundo rustica rustica]|uniref:Maestro/Maestro-like HEAT-repeats domain-containing protein n=1 Tax=Hirundo rustica rustica TaxID=333673 RepID=A0A3M0KY79_HIRRU|nr:hypothetical protein DUI87_04141 [Hirundo rustica rustica]